MLEGSASFACYPSCSDEDACSDGSDCVLDAYNHKVCADKCDSSAQEGCLEGETCRDDATARGSGYCVFSGAEGDGAPCGGLDRVCAPGLQCVYPAYAYFGTPRCAPTCSVSASDGAAGACKHGTCEPIWGDLGGCILPCDPFGSNSCSGKQTCEASLKVVMLDESLGQAEPSGQCGLPGEKKSGESCSGGDCVAGLVCGPILNDYAQSRYACGAPCSDEHPCSEGSCASLGLAAKGQQDYGTCQSSCSEVGADCPKGGWCAPSLTTKGLGLCVTEGATDKRKPCATSIECAKGLMCAPESLVCLPVCDPDGNDCSESEICVRADGHAYGVCTAAP